MVIWLHLYLGCCWGMTKQLGEISIYEITDVFSSFINVRQTLYIEICCHYIIQVVLLLLIASPSPIILFSRNWIALFIRTGQKRKGEVSSNALQQLRDELLRRLQKIIDASSEGELPDSMVVQASALLRLYCALRGIAAIK